METTTASNDVVVLALLSVFDRDIYILGGIVFWLLNCDREPAFNDACHLLPIRWGFISLNSAPVRSAIWRRTDFQKQIAQHATWLALANLLADWGYIQPLLGRL